MLEASVGVALPAHLQDLVGDQLQMWTDETKVKLDLCPHPDSQLTRMQGFLWVSDHLAALTRGRRPVFKKRLDGARRKGYDSRLRETDVSAAVLAALAAAG